MLLTPDEILIARTLVMGQKVRGRALTSIEVIQLNVALHQADADERARLGESNLVRHLIDEYRGKPTH